MVQYNKFIGVTATCSHACDAVLAKLLEGDCLCLLHEDVKCELVEETQYLHGVEDVV